MTKLADALQGVTRLGFDTAPLIYFVERHPVYLPVVKQVFQQVDNGRIAGFSGMISLAEVLVLPKKLNNAVLETAYRAVLFNSRNFSVLPIDAAIADRAADLRSRYKLKLPDALQIAAAVETKCEAFLTNDIGLRSVTDLRMLVLNELEL
jgi:predicted nucleic acid-binding protein